MKEINKLYSCKNELFAFQHSYCYSIKQIGKNKCLFNIKENELFLLLSEKIEFDSRYKDITVCLKVVCKGQIGWVNYLLDYFKVELAE